MRELRNIIERAITLSDNEYIDLPQLQSAPLRNVQNFVAGPVNHEPLTDQVIPLSPHRKIPAEGPSNIWKILKRSSAHRTEPDTLEPDFGC